MSGTDTPGNSISISGGTFQGNAIGIGHTQQHGTTVGSDSGVAELRTLLAAHAAEFVALGRTEDDRAEIRHEVRAIERELGEDEPSGPAVRSRWQAVLTALDGVIQAGSRLSEVTDLVNKVFGA